MQAAELFERLVDAAVTKGCDCGCPHCYLGLKRFKGVPWADKAWLDIMRDAAGSGSRSRVANR
ncbi:hypothetical protein [Streptomyces blattellae]|uniref:hypothetical protein n=1 Tax=Streptomyces blattellae TaxID=2569855 RepID=UPI0012B7ABBF|nr:hypothetical protein [Streptomyces blattellae]